MPDEGAGSHKEEFDKIMFFVCDDSENGKDYLQFFMDFFGY